MIPNLLSLLRIPLAFVFLHPNPLFRSIAILLAMITDFLDGHLARRYQQTTRLGLILDPLTDKFFVTSILAIFILENRLSPLEALTFFSRDIAVFLFGAYLLATHQLSTYRFPPFWCGKITTALQLVTLLALTLNLTVPNPIYWSLIILGIASIIELFLKPIPKEST